MNKYLFFFFIIMGLQLSAQEATANRFIVTGKVNDLLAQRADCSLKYKTSFNYYHIQLYNGQNMSKANTVKSNFTASFPEVKAVVEWESPEFKVWVGDYENKLSADQALLKIRKKYPNAFIVNPKK